ncbi:eEF1A lysine and N-terminal methyltransferase [Brachionichthys hirsutus]|uniref:eEF1A lysine and N-terminal methyltransferase n=1 Tax=Brachionichthys hirsutus TaxID=412623 RepID=UPI003604D5AF
MSLLPRTSEEFSSAEYWEKFFKRRGDKAFEWYGDYNKLCGVLHKYIKAQHKVLVVGCGNSELSEQLHDVGYKHLTNIDISETVVTRMNQRNAERRPGLTFQQVDATRTPYEDGSYQVALDKGTLDAMASEEAGALARSMLTEVGRVLSVAGRYVCVTLAQDCVIKLAVEHFVQQGWAVRLHCLQEKTEEEEEEEESFALPVFVLVCTKFRQPMPAPILEMCVGEDGAPTRLTQVAELLSAVREHQSYAVLKKKLRTSTDAESNLSLTLCLAKTGLPRYTLTVQDSPPDARVPRSNQFAVFIVPQGNEAAWLYSSREGRRQLAASANFRRLVIVAMHRNQEYTDMQAVQAELSPVVMEFAPPGMPPNQKVPFLSVGGDLGWREEVDRGVSELSGEYCVENVKGEDGELYRRLVFLYNSSLVQSEARLVSLNAGESSQKNKSKKKVKSKAAPKTPSASLSVDSGFLCCAHHEVIVAGLALLEVGMSQNKDLPVSVLLVGLGGGGLPQFLRDFVPNITVEVVELDPAIMEVAKKWFNFRPDDRLTVTLEDGLERIRALEKEGGCLFDAIIFDVDNKDATVGMNCPPAAFVETSILHQVHNLLTPRGLFILNLVCRNLDLRKSVLERVRNVFPTILSRAIEGEVNEVLLCSPREKDPSVTARIPASLNKAAKSLQSVLCSSRAGTNNSPHIKIEELLKDLKVE